MFTAQACYSGLRQGIREGYTRSCVLGKNTTRVVVEKFKLAICILDPEIWAYECQPEVVVFFGKFTERLDDQLTSLELVKPPDKQQTVFFARIDIPSLKLRDGTNRIRNH